MRLTTPRASLDLRIELLRLTIHNAGGYEHRLGPITARAAAILAERLDTRRASGPSVPPAGAAAIGAAPVRVDLARMSDDAVAREIAGAWLAALTPMPGGERASGRARINPAWPR
jgi:hypothetical protein